jgi:putative SOS response-associated peptidase YedK
MCGRFTLRTPTPILIEHFGLARIPALPPRFNIAPTQDVAVVRQPAAAREVALLRWGLIPAWAKDPAIGNRMINARAETVATKPAFRTAFRRRRCLVLADGFYEWKPVDERKQPYFIHRHDDAPMGLAGLWESWQSPDDPPQQLASCTIITTQANHQLRPIHQRMPVIVAPQQYATWLDPEFDDPDRLLPLLAPWLHDTLQADPVGTYVNKPSHEGPQCLAR